MAFGDSFGVTLPKGIMAEEAIQRAGLDFEVHKVPAYTPGVNIAGKEYPPAEIPGTYAMVRGDSGKAFQGTVGRLFTPFQNREAFAVTDALVAEGALAYAKAGCFDGGADAWILAELPGEIGLPGHGAEQNIRRYIMLRNKHDGSGSLRFGPTAIRPVCANTLAMATGQAGSEGVTIRHTASLPERVSVAKEGLAQAVSYFAAYGKLVATMARTPWTDAQMAEMVAHLYPSDATRSANVREEIQGLFRGGRGHGDIAGTAWAAVNAVAEYVDHHATSRSRVLTPTEARMKSAWFGQGMAVKARAQAFVEQRIAV